MKIILWFFQNYFITLPIAISLEFYILVLQYSVNTAIAFIIAIYIIVVTNNAIGTTMIIAIFLTLLLSSLLLL